MQKKIAKILSILLHPSLMPLIGVIIIFNAGTYLSYTPPKMKIVILLLIFIGTILLPILFLPVLLYGKIIKSIEMSSSRERILPFFIGSICYYLTYYYLAQNGFPLLITKFILASTITIFLIFLISIKWKISAHMVGIGGVIGFITLLILRLTADIQIFLVLFIFLSGLLGTVRLKLNAHTPSQIYVGFGLGLITVLLTFLIA